MLETMLIKKKQNWRMPIHQTRSNNLILKLQKYANVIVLNFKNYNKYLDKKTKSTCYLKFEDLKNIEKLAMIHILLGIGYIEQIRIRYT